MNYRADPGEAIIESEPFKASWLNQTKQHMGSLVAENPQFRVFSTLALGSGFGAVASLIEQVATRLLVEETRQVRVLLVLRPRRAPVTLRRMSQSKRLVKTFSTACRYLRRHGVTFHCERSLGANPQR